MRSTTKRERNHPSQIELFLAFESEEKSWLRQMDPTRDLGLQVARVTIAQISDAPPRFIDLGVLEDWTP